MVIISLFIYWFQTYKFVLVGAADYIALAKNFAYILVLTIFSYCLFFSLFTYVYLRPVVKL